MTKQDLSKKILKNLKPSEIEDIQKELKNINPYFASESRVLTDSQRAVMTSNAAELFKQVFDELKLDYKNDENLKDTPFRIASMWVNELMVGRYVAPPRIEAFPANQYNVPDIKETLSITSKDGYDKYVEIQSELDSIQEQIDNAVKQNGEFKNSLLSEAWNLLEELNDVYEFYIPKVIKKLTNKNMIVKKVDVNSLCSHHFIPFVSTDDASSKCLIAYVPTLGSDKALLGISKLQRIMDYFGRRPQLQETLNWQIRTYIGLILRSPHVMVSFHNIVHYCEKTRGVQSHCGSTSTIEYGGVFASHEVRVQALSLAE